MSISIFDDHLLQRTKSPEIVYHLSQQTLILHLPSIDCLPMASVTL